jgi:hypothetical protein
MRQRLQPMRLRSMARRPGEDRRFTLSPRDRRIAGWLAAAAVFVVVAAVVGILGGNADGTPVAPDTSATASASAGATIRFGTALDAVSGMVSAEAETNRFAAGDVFAYSVGAEGALPAAVYVGVERTGGGDPEVVQSAAEDGLQGLPDGATAIAFTVPASTLLAVFGPGEYRMTIYTDPTAAPIAEGTFVLVEVAPSGSGAPSASD